MGNNHHEKLYPNKDLPSNVKITRISINYSIVKDNEIQGNRKRNERVQVNIRGRTERQYYDTNQKKVEKIVQSNSHDKESKLEIEKDTRRESIEQRYSTPPLQD
ncbi:MAG: hypothetical protein EZS28_002332 [Streblomastix strix]|uniref:Uncharacterized protein n=1 Tax=Streblomastix strix TaxID=222440 RepID=A0A5J4X4I1_9EUKA|nr:MAG: hypothetical protein EZS28_002332 [Streblomastix strix]